MKPALGNAWAIRPFFLLLMAVGIVAASVLLTLHFTHTVSIARAPEAPLNYHISDARLETGLQAAADKLAGGGFRKTTTYQAIEARDAIRRGKFAMAQKLYSAALKKSHMTAWHFAPFNDFMDSISPVDDPGYLRALNKWVAEDPDNATPYLIRAMYHKVTGAARRGDNFASEVQPANMIAFNAQIAAAKRDVEKAIKLDPSNPYAYFLNLWTAGDIGDTSAIAAAFNEGIKAFPHYYPLYAARLRTLEPRWGGSVKGMIEFVDTYAASTKPDSPFRLLYVDLYEHLLSYSVLSCDDLRGNKRTECVEAVMDRIVPDGLEASFYSLLQQHAHFSEYAFSEELADRLKNMMACKCAQPIGGKWFQLTAEALGSDNRQDATDVSHNNYAMDRLAATVWRRMRMYGTAATLYSRALTDIAHTRFPNREARDRARAGIYRDLAVLSWDRKNYKQDMIYEMASRRLLGIPYPSVEELSTLDDMKRFRMAIKASTERLHAAGGMPALHWRGSAYDKLKEYDKMMKDFRRVADSENIGNGYAATEMVIVYADRHQWKKALAVLEDHPYLYDKRLQSRYGMASDYNNLCWVKKHLGDLEGALKDCTISLSYDTLPEALKKQEDLIRLLKKKHKASHLSHPRAAGNPV